MGETPAVHLRRAVLRVGALAVLVAGLLACSGGDDAATTTTAAGRSGSIDVLTYNVAGLPQEISDVNPSQHIPLISPLLKPYDVVLTQEDFDWWQGDLASGLDFVNYHTRLRAEAGHQYATPRHPGPEAAGLDPATRPTLQIGDGEAIMSRYPLADVQRRAWKGCFGGFDTKDGGAGDCLAMKGFAVATMTLPGGAEVDVYTLHGEAGGTDEDQKLQAADFAQLAAFVNQHSKGRAVILGGDTNLHTDPSHPDAEGSADTEIWTAFLKATGLTDACAATDCPDTGSIDKLTSRDGGGVTLKAVSHDMPRDTFKDPSGEDLSDHPPVVVTFDWSSAG